MRVSFVYRSLKAIFFALWEMKAKGVPESPVDGKKAKNFSFVLFCFG